MRELQIRRMVELAQALPTERPVHYCEVGMNGGHSVVSMLLAHPNLTAHVTDPHLNLTLTPTPTLTRTEPEPLGPNIC